MYATSILLLMTVMLSEGKLVAPVWDEIEMLETPSFYVTWKMVVTASTKYILGYKVSMGR